MSNKTFLILIIAVALGFGGYIVYHSTSTPKEAILGVQHANQGQDHILRGKSHSAYNSSPASSGPHYNDQGAPAPWGAYTQEVPQEVFIHNEEHGGVVITYNPDLLPASDVAKLQKLFTSPYSDSSFNPNKGLVTPRKDDKHAIEIASWTYTLNLDKYDQSILEKYYLQHVGQAPENGAGPSNVPAVQQ